MSLLNDLMNAANGGGGFDIEKLAGQIGDRGLEGIVAKFEQGGMGKIVQSWIGTGHNLPISSEQIVAVLGSEQAQNLTHALGIDSSQLAHALPGLIDHLTPNGQLPQGNLTDVLLQAASRGGFGDAISGLFKA
jgi:uncharacterized protein YidB (DUF937 family)